MSKLHRSSRTAAARARGVTRTAIVLTVFLGLLASGGVALGDAPGPREMCEGVEGCQSCWQHYGAGPEDAASYKKCADEMATKGLVEACRYRQGAGDTVIFCPTGTKVEKTIKGGGCGACAVGSEGSMSALAAGALFALAAALWTRRRAPSPR